jgi:uncharacterized membrane protein YgdD (TMEM256/DUF423 family)
MRVWLLLAAINGALAVLFGAFAAHGLKGRLPADMLAVFDTGARYHLAHALAMGLSALAARGAAAKRANTAAALFLTGIVLFCGSLYLLAMTDITTFGLITPLGGVAFIAGWVTLAAASVKLEAP